MATIKIRILLEIKRFSVAVERTFGIRVSIIRHGYLYSSRMQKRSYMHTHARVHTFKFSLIGLIFLYQTHPTITDTDG